MKKNILLGITGSIAAYKAADIASLLTKAGHSVTAIMTADAQEFITPLTLQTLTRNPVVAGLYDEKQSWRHGHIQLADGADLLLIAFATRAPILLAPAMNGKMWSHPATVRNIETLRAWGHHFIGPDDGMLACGYEGTGRLWPVEGIVERALELLA